MNLLVKVFLLPINITEIKYLCLVLGSLRVVRFITDQLESDASSASKLG